MVADVVGEDVGLLDSQLGSLPEFLEFFCFEVGGGIGDDALAVYDEYVQFFEGERCESSDLKGGAVFFDDVDDFISLRSGLI